MSKYKLINLKTKEEHLCDKVTIDGFDYYVNDYISDEVDGGLTKIPFEKLILIAVTTNNPNIDIPKVVDEVEMLGEDETNIRILQHKTPSQIARQYFDGYEEGYNKCLETNGNSDEDMLEFALYVATAPNTPYKTVKELLQIWKDQRPKIVYYGTN